MGATDATVRQAGNKAKQAIDNPWVERLIRFGYVVRGVLYIVMGLIAVGVVIGTRSAPQDPVGALHEIGAQPDGKFLLILMAIGLAAYSLWGLIRAIWDPLGRGTDTKGLVDRIGFLWSSISYGILIIPALQLSVGVGGGSTGSTPKTQDLTAQLLHSSFGVWIVALLGLAAVGVGLGQIY